MTRGRRSAVAFGGCAAAAVLALAGLTRSALDVERRAADARREAARLQDLRLALWPADGAVGAYLAQEAARRDEDFVAGRRFDDDPPFVVARAAFDEGGAARAAVEGGAFEAFGGLAPEQRAALIAAAPPTSPAAIPAPAEIAASSPWDAQVKGRADRASENRTQQVFVANSFPAPSDDAPRAGPFGATWLDVDDVPTLFLARRATFPSGKTATHAVRLDFDALSAAVAAATGDAGCRLLPWRGDPTAPPGEGRLAVLPATLVPGPRPTPAADDGFGVGRSLAAAWGAVGLAVVGGAALLVAAHRLGERRGRFVSAVTHELRTPLTTFRLYADLLADARDGDSGRRADYVATLQTEAARLARVVEGVLLYARLEEGAARARRERVDAAELVERALAPSTRRAAEAGFELEVDVESMRGVVVDADPQAVEQILLNLVDNACKYAAAAPSRRIMIDGVAEARAVRIRVADEGPGVPAGQESAIFRPFRRAATHAVEATPGAGLGLALARGLARAGGGALRLLPRRAEGGACFELALPRAGAERR